MNFEGVLFRGNFILLLFRWKLFKCVIIQSKFYCEFGEVHPETAIAFSLESTKCKFLDFLLHASACLEIFQ